MSEKKVRVKLTKSPITSNKRQKATLRALGLRKMNQSVEHADNPTIRGMIAKVDYLVTVETVQ
jgi:large subunit ribosomal protein L30